jgi:hypothetical protein
MRFLANVLPSWIGLGIVPGLGIVAMGIAPQQFAAPAPASRRPGIMTAVAQPRPGIGR